MEALAIADEIDEIGSAAETSERCARADLVLLDAGLHDDGSSVAVAAIARLRRTAPWVPVLVTSDEPAPDLVQSALEAGAVSYLQHDCDLETFVSTVHAAMRGRGLLDVAAVRPLLGGYARMLDERARRDRAVIASLAAAVEAKDAVTSRHLHAVSRLAMDLGALVDSGLLMSEDFLFGCLVHDVGKIGVPEGILSKPGPLDEDEWRVMRLHPATGVNVLAPLGRTGMVTDIVLHHHERWDGDGYPDGLTGDAIPLPARVFAVCDALEAMTSPRPYRGPLAPEEAFARVVAEGGRQFDPRVVAALEDAVAAGGPAVLASLASR